MLTPLGTTMGNLELPVRTVPGEKEQYLSAITQLSSVPSPTMPPRMIMQLRSFAPFSILAPEKIMQFSMLPSILQLSATRLLRETAFSPY